MAPGALQVLVGGIVERNHWDRFGMADIDPERRAHGNLTYAQLEALDYRGRLDQVDAAQFSLKERFQHWIEKCRVAYVLRDLPRIRRWSDLNPYLDGSLTYNDQGGFQISRDLAEIAIEQHPEVDA